jgi:alpha-galactosidase
MESIKVVVIGAGSFVFGPSVLGEAILNHRLEGLELALVDVDPEVLDLMAGVGRRMAKEAGVDTRITTHTERRNALPDADFVICSASPQMQQRFATDCAIIDRCAPGHLVSEFGGIAGISYSLRQIALIEAIADDMRALCPEAWLLNVANPLPRVCQAAHESGVRTVGFCSVSISGYGMVERLLTGASVSYPFAEPQEKWEAKMAGVNHLSWLVELRDRATQADLLPALQERLQAGATAGHPRAEQLARETGCLLTPGDDHTKDFLTPAGAGQRTSASHGTPEERHRRLNLLKGVGEGRRPWDELIRSGSWEKPVDLIAAMALDRPAYFPSLNLINQGQIPDLPSQVFVETPCTADREGPKPERVLLPEPILPYCQHTAQVTDTIVRAARQRSRALLRHAVALDPTVLDKQAGIMALEACLEAHADLLPSYQ